MPRLTARSAAAAGIPRYPRWRIAMWLTCAAMLAATLILLGMDIGHARIPPGVFDWSLAVFALSTLVPLGELAVRVLRADLSACGARVDALTREMTALRASTTGLHKAITQMRAEYADRLDNEMLRGSQAALDELGGGSVRAFPQRVPTSRRPVTDRRP